MGSGEAECLLLSRVGEFALSYIDKVTLVFHAEAVLLSHRIALETIPTIEVPALLVERKDGGAEADAVGQKHLGTRPTGCQAEFLIFERADHIMLYNPNLVRLVITSDKLDERRHIRQTLERIELEFDNIVAVGK